MMEDHEFCDNCPGCRPAMLDIKTGNRVPNDSPLMMAINDVWDNHTSYSERKAFIEVTLHNSRLPNEVKLWEQVAERIQKALEGVRDV